ncbi:TniQ family protein [Streptomyces nondiastaticus]|uniref:TniQ family protein n=1 Tax=Streptomyces nondiastaticus TaxID=3154512 RepID=UPI003430D084
MPHHRADEHSRAQIGIPRRLPLVPLPAERESLASWLRRLSGAYDLDRKRGLEAVGLAGAPEMRPRVVGVALSAPSTARLCGATGLKEDEVSAMLLSQHASSALPNLPCVGKRFVHYLGSTGKTAWRFPDHSTWCPDCLAETGHWRVDWLMPWTFMCQTHGGYLLSSCPVCRLPQSGPAGSGDPLVCQRSIAANGSRHPDRSRYPRGYGPACGTRLDQAETQPVTDPLSLQAQAALTRWLCSPNDAEEVAEAEFVSLVAVVLVSLTPSMVDEAPSPVRKAVLWHSYYRGVSSHRSLTPAWAQPLRMAGAAHVAQWLTAAGQPLSAMMQWLQEARLRDEHLNKFRHTHQQLGIYTTRLNPSDLVHGPWYHRTRTLQAALQTDLIALPQNAPAHLAALTPHDVRVQAVRRRPLPYSR